MANYTVKEVREVEFVYNFEDNEVRSLEEAIQLVDLGREEDHFVIGEVISMDAHFGGSSMSNLKEYYIAVPFSEVIHGVEYFTVSAQNSEEAIERIKDGNAPCEDRGEIQHGTFNSYWDDLQILSEESHNDD